MVRNIQPPSAGTQIDLPQQVTQRSIPLIERQVDDLLARCATSIELACPAVQIIDSLGLNWLLSTKARLDAAGVALKLVALSPIMADILAATRLDSRFTIVNEQNAGSPRNA